MLSTQDKQSTDTECFQFFGYLNNICNTLTILQFEVVNILVALRLWTHFWAHKKIQIFSDNLAVVNVLNSGRILDDFLVACACTLWAIAAEHDVTLIIITIDNDIVRELLQCRWWQISYDYFYPDFFYITVL